MKKGTIGLGLLVVGLLLCQPSHGIATTQQTNQEQASEPAGDTFLPLSAVAVSDSQVGAYATGNYGDFHVSTTDGLFNWDNDSKILTLTSSNVTYTVSMNKGSGSTSHRIVIDGADVTVIIKDLDIRINTAPILMSETASATIDLAGENKFTSTSNRFAGLQNNNTSDENSLKIISTANPTSNDPDLGQLTVQGGNSGASIGGGSGNTGTVNISGGVVNATSSGDGASIGGGRLCFGIC